MDYFEEVWWFLMDDDFEFQELSRCFNMFQPKTSAWENRTSSEANP